MDEKVKELESRLKEACKMYADSQAEYDRLSKDYVNSRTELHDAKQLNERYLKIIENLTEGGVTYAVRS